MGVWALPQGNLGDHLLEGRVVRLGQRLRKSLADLPLEFVAHALEHHGDVDAVDFGGGYDEGREGQSARGGKPLNFKSGREDVRRAKAGRDTHDRSATVTGPVGAVPKVRAVTELADGRRLRSARRRAISCAASRRVAHGASMTVRSVVLRTPGR